MISFGNYVWSYVWCIPPEFRLDRMRIQASVSRVISGEQFRRNGTPMVPMPRFT
jgi:hypothetical protein